MDAPPSQRPAPGAGSQTGRPKRRTLTDVTQLSIFRGEFQPLAPEFEAALKFLRGFSVFDQCPEFDFESCWWRFTRFEGDASRAYKHRCFDEHAQHFSPGLHRLLGAHAELADHGMSFLEIAQRNDLLPKEPAPVQREAPGRLAEEPAYRYDVAISFAGPERTFAEELASAVRQGGFEVFYDGFYPEQLWGKDLVTFFDNIYRKDSRFCVMFVSSEYAARIWTNHERRSAQARALQEKGQEYILPIRIDDTELDGLPPTVGHLKIADHSIAEIAALLLKKLRHTR
jgi:hypothetical protein